MPLSVASNPGIGPDKATLAATLAYPGFTALNHRCVAKKSHVRVVKMVRQKITWSLFCIRYRASLVPYLSVQHPYTIIRHDSLLKPFAQAELKLELRRLRSKLMSLHEQSIPAPLTEKDGIGVLLAIRRWEPIAFHQLRRALPGPQNAKKTQPTTATLPGIGTSRIPTR